MTAIALTTFIVLAVVWSQGPSETVPQVAQSQPEPAEGSDSSPAEPTQPAPGGNGHAEPEPAAASPETPDTTPDASDAEEPGPPAGSETEEPAPPDADAPTPEPAKEEDDAADQPPAEPEVPAASGRPEPFEDIRRRHLFVELPDRAEAIKNGDAPVEIAKLQVERPEQCELSIVGAETVFGETMQIELSRPEEEPAGTWHVDLKSTRSISPEGTRLGTFRLAESALRFAWKPEVPPSIHPQLLKYCLLRIRVDGEEETCFLSRPRLGDPFDLDFNQKARQTPLPLNLDDLPDAKHLQFELRAEGFPEHETTSSTSVRGEKSATIQVFHPGSERAAFLDLTVELNERQRQYRFTVRPFATYTEIKSDMKTQQERIAWDRRQLPKVRTELGKVERKLRRETDKEPKEVVLARNYLERSEGVDGGSAADTKARRARSIVANWDLKVERLTQLLEVVRANESWCEEMESLLDDLESDGVVHYRIFVEIEGTNVGILQSEEEPPAE